MRVMPRQGLESGTEDAARRELLNALDERDPSAIRAAMVSYADKVQGVLGPGTSQLFSLLRSLMNLLISCNHVDGKYYSWRRRGDGPSTQGRCLP